MRVRASSRVDAVWIALVALVAGALLGGGTLLGGCSKKKPKDPTCSADKDCKDGLKCVNKTCQQCGVDGDCPDGQKCIEGACEAAPECKVDGDCPDGKVCEAGVCKACKSNDECGPGGRCEAGACKRATACKTDDECADDEDCVDGFCQKPWADGGGTATCPLATVYFAFDVAAVPADQRDALASNAECAKSDAARPVLLVGHTDEIGTDEYNIAL